MKYKYLLLLCLFCFEMQAQIADLNKLSKGKFYSSDAIKDGDNNIKGYFLLFELDRVAKETYELEYIVLDENLNKVTSGEITEMKYDSWLVGAKKISVHVSLYGDKLLLRFADDFSTLELFKRYRILDISKNELSTPFIFNKGKMVVDPVFNRKVSDYERNESQEIYAYKDIGLIVNSTFIDKKENSEKQYMARFDNDMKEQWRWVYEDFAVKSKKRRSLKYLNSDSDVLVMFNRYSKDNREQTYLPEVSILFIDAKKGELTEEFTFPDLEEFSYRVADCHIADNKVYVMGNYAEGNKYASVHDDKNIGLYKMVFDKTTGKLLDSKYFKWENLINKLDIKKNGYVKKEGNLYTHEMLVKSDGSIIVVAEAFLNHPVTTNNMYFFEFDKEFAIKDVFEVSKFRNKFSGTSAYSEDIKKYGAFDFIDYQNLGDDEYLFYLNDNEKNSRNRSKSTLYGVVSYSDGAFKRQTIDLKTEHSTIKAFNAKKGYLLLVEDFDDKNKSSEFRLEKINY